MLFNSLEFVVFFCGVLAMYAWAPQRWRIMLLLCVSYGFYAYANVWHLGILLFVTWVTYTGGRLLAASRSIAVLSLTVGLNLICLGFFKYYSFAEASLSSIGYSLPHLEVLLPIGISFFVFQSVSYLVDIHSGRLTAERRPAVVALYLAFFPQILAGPIERAGDLIPQFDRTWRPDSNRVFVGLKILMWGFFCKLILADKIDLLISPIFAEYADQSGVSLLVATLLYSFQIYFDFYGYTTIAFGLAHLLGINLSQNFRNPYLARSIRDFWRRWHITLARWFRDYVYIPMGGRSDRVARLSLNVATVFVLSGLWHGAALTFITWGALHATFYIFGKVTLRPRRRLVEALGVDTSAKWYSVVQVLGTFALVSLAWVIFRAETISDSFAIWSSILGITGSWGDTVAPVFLRAESIFWIANVILFWMLDSVGIVQRILESIPSSIPALTRELALVNVCVVMIILTGDVGSKAFIYFRF